MNILLPDDMDMFDHLILKNDDQFVKSSYVMPLTRHLYYKCSGNISTLFEGIVSDNIIEMIQAGLEPITRRIKELLINQTLSKDAILDSKDITFCAPIPHPGKIVGAAYNFTDALDERSMPYPSEPVIFIRSGSTTIGPFDPILIPPDVGNADASSDIQNPIMRINAEINGQPSEIATGPPLFQA